MKISTFGPYSFTLDPIFKLHNAMDAVMNSLVQSGWDIFSVTSYQEKRLIRWSVLVVYFHCKDKSP